MIEQRKILIAAVADSTNNPRPNRMILYLKDRFEVSYLGTGCLENIKFIALPEKDKSLRKRVKKLFKLITKQFEDYVSFKNEIELIEILQGHHFHLIICHDLILLPLLSRVNNCKNILFDAREYYPRHFEDRPLWNLFNKSFNNYLCKKYLKIPQHCLTVSEGLAGEYYREFGINMKVMYSIPIEEKIQPSKVDPNNIRIIYHGSAVPSRNIESVIKIMKMLDERFTLDLMLVPTNNKYYNKINNLSRLYNNINLVPPVKFSEIVHTISKYDIGLFYCPPSTFNLKHSMPNKFFEYIQARLAVAIGPSPDMKQFVEEHNIGIVSECFTPDSMAYSLNNLQSKDIDYFKHESHKAAKIYNASLNNNMILDLVDRFN